ncbi:MAG: hypothetical protein AMJ73_01635 [candidate division Zixibacteria bacterium SM1_73]|nr:MAG: hypothetical protein AMJ73_01635 [candidate division Zixibacteria bacterium SM1_73]
MIKAATSFFKKHFITHSFPFGLNNFLIFHLLKKRDFLSYRPHTNLIFNTFSSILSRLFLCLCQKIQNPQPSLFKTKKNYLSFPSKKMPSQSPAHLSRLQFPFSCFLLAIQKKQMAAFLKIHNQKKQNTNLFI